MQKMIWTGIGISVAAVVGTTSLFGASKLPYNHAIKTPIQLEQTTQSMSQPTETASEDATVKIEQPIENPQKVSETTVSLDSVYAYYGTISDIDENGILIQGLQDNAINDRGQIRYLKSDIAAVSGYTGDSACTSVDDLKIGDRICVIASGSVIETSTAYLDGSTSAPFTGVAKIILISRDGQTKSYEGSADKVLTRAAVRYAQKLAEKTTDTEYLSQVGFSDTSVQYLQSAEELLNSAPQQIMEIKLEDVISSLYTNESEVDSSVYNNKLIDMLAGLFGNTLNSEPEVVAAFGAVSENEYLSTYEPMVSQGSVALWLYYGDDLPTAFVTFVPKSQQEDSMATESNITEVRATLVEVSAYQNVKTLLEQDGSVDGTWIEKAIAKNAILYNDLNTFNPVNLNQEYYVGTAKDKADEAFYRSVAYSIISAPNDMYDLILSAVGNDNKQSVSDIQNTLTAALTGMKPGTLETYYAPTDQQYALDELCTEAFSVMKDINNQAISSNISAVVHSQMPAYSSRKDWDRDVLMVYSFSDLTVLISIKEADNAFLKITPTFLLKEDGNSEIGSSEQIEQYIQSLIQKYKFEKFNITE